MSQKPLDPIYRINQIKNVIDKSIRDFDQLTRKYTGLKYLRICVNKLYEARKIFDDIIRTNIDFGIYQIIQIISSTYVCLDILSNEIEENIREQKTTEISRIISLMKKHLNIIKNATLEYMCLSSIPTNNMFLSKIVPHIVNEKIRSAKEFLLNNNYTMLDIVAMTYSKLVPGTNDIYMKILFGTAISIHRFLGIPYIPASSIKGVIRTYLEEQIGDKAKIGDKLLSFDEILGTINNKGTIVIFDAYPDPSSLRVSTRIICPDVMTPIYADGTPEPRIEEHRANPIPVIYPVVCPNTRFRFIFGLKRDYLLGDSVLIDAFKSWVKQALLSGVGGKTRLGYGILLG